MLSSDRAMRTVVFGLLITETAALLFLLYRNHPVARTELAIEPGKNYSLLVNDERFPIGGNPGDKIVVEVRQTAQPPAPLQPGRTRIVETPDQLAMAVPHESRFRFVYDDPRALAPFRNQEKLERLRTKDDWQTVLNVMGWARKQFEAGTPKEYPPQNAVELLAALRSGKEQGFCAQYCYLMVQALQALGYKARYITIQGHEVAESWVPSLHKWVLLDPTNNVHFEDDKGARLSALEVARKQTEAHPVPASTSDVTRPVHYRLLCYWLRNDLFTRPLNIYDLNQYRVTAILDPSAVPHVSPGDLVTYYPDELYSPPVDGSS